MNRKLKFTLIMLTISIVWIVGFYGWVVPKILINNKPKIEEHLRLYGFTPIEMIDVNGWYSTTTWKVTKPDSLGNPVEKIVDVELRKSIYVLKPNKGDTK